MKNHKFFAGVDWGRESHQVCLVDQEGSVTGEKSFSHSGGGLLEMARWMMEVSGSQPPDIAAAIEVNHGPVVESLVEQDFLVYSINPRQLDRFRDRFCVSGAKDDRRDAMVLASALRTDRDCFRRLEPQDPDIIVLGELNRTREELVGERTRLVNRFRGLLWRYYPQFGELIGNTVRPWHLELWELVPCPDSARRKRVSTVKELLKRNRVWRVDAKGVLEMLRGEKMSVNKATAQSCIAHIRSVVQRMADVYYEIIPSGVLGRLVTEREHFTLPLHFELPGRVFQLYRYFKSLKPDVQIHILALKWLELRTNLRVRYRLMQVPREGKLKVCFRMENWTAFGQAF